MFTGSIGMSLGFNSSEHLVWYVLFIVFVTYGMLPLPLRWSMIAGFTTAFVHVIVTTVYRMSSHEVSVLSVYRFDNMLSLLKRVLFCILHPHITISIEIEKAYSDRTKMYCVFLVGMSF